VTRSKTTGIKSADISHEAVKRAFADVLCCLRHRVSLTQETLATDTQIGRDSIASMELGRHGPTLGMLFRLSPGLRVAPDFIVAVTATRLRAMQNSAFDPSTSPLPLQLPDIARSHTDAAAPDMRKVRLAVAMVVTALRLQAECSHRQYARAAGIDCSYEIQIEGGEINPTLTTVLRLSAGAGLPAESVVHGVQLLIRANLNTSALSQWMQSIAPSAKP
jgi:transcriptional regulator with XRE-family HTH domain